MSKTFYRWVKNPSSDLNQALECNKLVYTNNGKPSRKARWLTEKGADYVPNKRLMKDRVLVVFELSDGSAAFIKNKTNQISSEDTSFNGEAKHPKKIIVKNNEKGAYGVGMDLCTGLVITSTKVATKKEYAKVLKLNEMEIPKGFNKVKKYKG